MGVFLDDKSENQYIFSQEEEPELKRGGVHSFNLTTHWHSITLLSFNNPEILQNIPQLTQSK